MVTRRAVLRTTLRATTLVVICAAAAYAWWRAGGRPQRDGNAVIAQLAAPVEIRFDDAAVPHVRASSLPDAARALGWLHANERMGQMELMRRYVQGRLAELAGESAVRSDRGVREMRFPQAVDALHAAVGAEGRTVLDAYAQGVNAWLEHRDGDLPPDLRMMRADPEPWSARDSLCVQMMMSQMLSNSGARELNRLVWIRNLGVQRAALIIGDPLTNVPAEALREVARELDSHVKAEAQASSNGSNNWAVDSSRTADGHALVANDPHLNLSLPSIWFQVQMRCPEYEASGFTVPGLPLVVIGQGPHVAWGFTNTELDVFDAFVERVSEDGRSVERDGEWVPVAVHRERIEVRGEDPVEFDALSTDIGPLLTWRHGLRYSVAWTAHTPFDPVQPFLDLARASSVDSVPSIAASFVGPPQNLVCGDSSGAIAFTVLGRNVERGVGDGRVPLPAWERANHWRGLRPHEHSPGVLRPEQGLVATANDDTRREWSEHPYPLDCATSHRAQRIVERLDVRRDWTPETLAALQTDTVSLYAREMVAALAELAAMPGPPLDSAAQSALRELSAWDGAMDVRGAAALYHLCEARIDEWMYGALGTTLSHPERDRVRLEAVYGRFDGPFGAEASNAPRGIADRRAELMRALSAAWREGVGRWGEPLEQWNYGELHKWRPAHRLGGVPLLGAAFDLDALEVPGSATCPYVFSGPRLRAEDDLPRTSVEHGASLRIVADCADPDRSLAILPGGQSGHPFDDHYADQLERYLAGELRPMRWSEGAIERATVSVLRLDP